MAAQPKKKSPAKDPLNAWLARRIKLLFVPLLRDYGFEPSRIVVDNQSCFVSFLRRKDEVEVWSDYGEPPQVDLILNSKRVTLDYVLQRDYRNRRLPPKPVPRAAEAKKKHYAWILNHDANVLRDLGAEILGQ